LIAAAYPTSSHLKGQPVIYAFALGDRPIVPIRADTPTLILRGFDRRSGCSLGPLRVA
jgi:hypothetical protein